MSDPGFFHGSKAQALVVSLEHSRHRLLGPAPIRAQPRPRVPAVADHHLIAGAGGGEAVLGGGGLMVQAELVQGGGEMGRGVAAEVAPTHLTPLAHWVSVVRRAGHGSERTNGTAGCT